MFILNLIVALGLLSQPAVEPMSEYYSDERGTVMLLGNGMGYFGNNPIAPRPVGESVRSHDLLDPLSRPSLANGRCVAYRHTTFAIVDQMRTGSTFLCNGVAFKVDQCRPAGSCQWVQISAQCQGFSEGQCRSSAYQARRPADYRYIYDRERGLLSADFAPGDRRGRATLRLVGANGFKLD